MKRLLILVMVAALLPPHPLAAETSPPPDIASYRIEATYGVGSHVLSGKETLTYVNRSDVPMPDLVFHLYLNAFRNEETLWMREVQETGGMAMRGYAFDADAPGWMRVDTIRLDDGTPLSLEPLDRDETLVRARLPYPVPPGSAVTVTLEFAAQLPHVFARTGWADGGDFVMAGQWFPKAGVWQGEQGWNAYPFHANSEFFADFGSYDVRLSLPEGWVLAATGEPVESPKRQANGHQLHHLTAEHVIDFAWGASPHLVSETMTLADGVALHTYFYPDQRRKAHRLQEAVAKGYALYEEWYAPYGMGLYDDLTMLLVPPDAGGAGGMEYPKLFTVGALSNGPMPTCVHMPEIEALHELGHQWFQSMVATNEAEEPWMDEGMTDFAAARAIDALYGGDLFDCKGWHFTYLEMRRLEFTMAPTTPMSGTAWELGGNYPIATYSKPVVVFTTLERVAGEEKLNTLFRTYVERYAFTHPTAADFLAVMEETLGQETTSWFRQMVESGATLDAVVRSLGEDQAILEREGDLCIPEKVALFNQHREATFIEWGCQEEERERLTVTYDGLQEVQIDPDHQIALDLKLGNNGLRQRADATAGLSLFAILLHWTEELFALGGGVW